MANIEWTEDFEQKLTDKLMSEYKQADDMVVWASKSEKPFKHGVIRVRESARGMVEWIKKELGV